MCRPLAYDISNTNFSHVALYNITFPVSIPDPTKGGVTGIYCPSKMFIILGIVLSYQPRRRYLWQFYVPPTCLQIAQAPTLKAKKSLSGGGQN